MGVFGLSAHLGQILSRDRHHGAAILKWEAGKFHGVKPYGTLAEQKTLQAGVGPAPERPGRSFQKINPQAGNQAPWQVMAMQGTSTLPSRSLGWAH